MNKVSSLLELSIIILARDSVELAKFAFHLVLYTRASQLACRTNLHVRR